MLVIRQSTRALLSTPCRRLQKQTRTMSKISFASENAAGDCPGVFVGDLSKTKKGLIVLQEWWGMNEQIQEEAADIVKRSKDQLVTLVPDLYRGKVAIDQEDAGHKMDNLDWPGAVKDIQGAARYLIKQGCTKVGVTGFCMGGALTLAAAALVPEISAAAPFYGIPSPDLADVSKIKIPVQCHFGSEDALEGFTSPKDQEVLKTKLKDGGVKFEFHSYKAGHAFTNTTGPNFNKDCCDRGLKTMIKFMEKSLD